MNVQLGNVAAKEKRQDEWYGIDGNQITHVSHPGKNIETAFIEIVELWEAHSEDNPVWVDGSNAKLVARLAKHFGCPKGRPKDWR